MPILRKRRGRPAGQGDTIAPPPPPRLPVGRKLEELLREIAGASAPEEALEPALRAILEAAGAHAGALCLFDARHSIMRLAAEVGLSEEGCARLRSVRRGDPTSWDMPLHGLLNRRAYLIESAPRNRYVPPLVEQFSTVRSVACVPLYGNSHPLGSLILIALAPRSFAERDIHALERPLRELGRIVEAARRRPGTPEELEAAPMPSLRGGGGPLPIDVVAIVAERDRLRDEIVTRQAERASLAAELAAHAGENDHLRVALEQAGDERQRLAVELERAHREAERATILAASLEDAEKERARVLSALEAAAAERVAQTQTLIELEQARRAAERAAESALADLDATRRVLGASAASAGARVTELGTEVEHLHARLAEAEAAVAQERTRAEERAGAQQRLTQDLHEAVAREQRLRTELRATSEQQLSGEQGDLRQALAAVQTAEDARTAALAEADAARVALASTQGIVEALEEEAARAHAEVERLAGAERRARAAQELAEEELAALRVREQQAAARLTEVEREAAALRDERARLAAAGHEHHATVATHTARLETLTAERGRLEQALATAAAERARLVADAATATAARARLENALTRETAERTRLGSALGDLQEALAGLESTQARHKIEAVTRAAEIEQLRAECQRLGTERDRLLAERASTPERTGAPEASETPVRVVTVAAVGAPRQRALEDEAAGATIVVLDVDGTWESASITGHAVVVIAPGPGLLERIAAMPPARIVANLAAPGVLEAVIALRAGGSTARVWGCLASPGTDRALALGMIEPTTRPLDPDAVLCVLARYATRGTRLVTAGADVDALMSLRQALARQGMSVSMAWDAKQAADLMGVVRPEVAVVDLALPRRDGYAIVAGLAAGDPPPSAVLVPGDGDAAAAFAAALADPKRSEHVVPLDRVLGDVVSRSEEAPLERKQKVRALGRK